MLSTKPWRTELVLMFCVAIMTCWTTGTIVGAALYRIGAPGFAQPDAAGPIIIATLSFQGLALPLILLFLKQHQLRLRDGLGLAAGNTGRTIGLAAAVTIGILPLILLLQAAMITLLTWLGLDVEMQTPITVLGRSGSLGLRIYLCLFAVFIAPIAEEFIFRGVLYPFFKQLGFPRLALWGVSAFFAFIHLNAAVFLPLLFFAVVLTWLYERTDSLLAPIVAHMVFNGTNLLLLLLTQMGILHLSK